MKNGFNSTIHAFCWPTVYQCIARYHKRDEKRAQEVNACSLNASNRFHLIICDVLKVLTMIPSLVTSFEQSVTGQD